MKLLLGCCLILSLTREALAEGVAKSRAEAEALAATLKYQQGEIVLQNGLATLRVPEGFRFLDRADANKVIVQMWDNPPPPGDDLLGMLMSETGPFGHDAWAVVISYEKDGFVRDQDAEAIDYRDLFKQMKEGIHQSNPERTRQGYPTMELVGWAAPPRYDHDSHKLYWAKELKFGGESENTLNYHIRMLGRSGVIVLNAVASMWQLPQIESSTPGILSAIDFSPGNQYADFDPKSDKIATYGLTALVAGDVAAKTGGFQGLGPLIIIIIIIAIAGAALVQRVVRQKVPVATENRGG
jgi:uncharacterized membrane-anchored protein